MKRCSF